MAKERRYDYKRVFPDPIGLDVNSLYKKNVTRFTYAASLTWDKDDTLVPLQNLPIADNNLQISNLNIVRMWFYQTLPTGAENVYSYLIVCTSNVAGNSFSLYTSLWSGSSWGVLTAVPSLRDVNSSTRIHQVAFSRGLAYVQAFPTGGDKLGCVILDGSSGTIVTRPWGMLGPTTPAMIVGAVDKLNGTLTATNTTITVDSTTGFPASGRLQIGYERIDYTGTTATTFTGCTRGVDGTDEQEHQDDTTVIWRDWGPSAHPVTVKIGWKYTYCYVSVTGQVSNRAEEQFNPDLMPSFTGPFNNLIPEIEVQGLADTTNFPYINIYRTTDGQGTFWFLEQIPNTGAGTITYFDDSFGTGGSSTSYNDPVPDLKINAAVKAPSLTSNSPPGVVTPPLVVGVDNPSVQSYAMTSHVGRIWKGVKNYLLYSALEELVDGIGEESFPSGTLGGNYMIFNGLITGLISNNNALYIFTESNIYKLTGSSRDTFAIQKVSDIGAKLTLTNGAAAAYDNQVAFIGSNGGIYLLDNDIPRLISNEIERGSAWPISSSSSVLSFFENNLYKYLLVSAGRSDYAVPDTHTKGYVYCYNIRKSQEYNYDFWNPIWDVLNGTILTINTGTTPSGIYSSTYNSLAPKSLIRQMQFTDAGLSAAYFAYITDAGVYTYGPNSKTSITNYVRIPAGNLVNFNNIPGRDVKATKLFIMSYHNASAPLPAGNPYTLSVSFDNSTDVRSFAWADGSNAPRILTSNDPYTIKAYALDRDTYQCRVSITNGIVYFKISDMFIEFFPGYTATD